MQIELLTRDRDVGHDLTARLAKALVLLEEPVTMKRVLVDDETLPALALRVKKRCTPSPMMPAKQTCSSCSTTF